VIGSQRSNLSGDGRINAAWLMLFAAIVFLNSGLNAQTFYGSILGNVADASGSVVPDATVVVTDTATNTTHSAKTDNAGKFSIVNLVPADYKVEISKDGFKRFVSEHNPVQVGSAVRVDSVLAIGNVSDAVEVTSAAPLLQTDSSTISQVIEGLQLQETPLNGRNVLNMIALAPGVVPTGGSLGETGLNQGTRTAGGSGWGNYQIGGGIQGQSAQYIDGVANNLLGGNIVALVPTQDAVQEFSVASSNATADFGRFAGGVVNMTTRSGTNSIHGSAWEYLRNADLNANDFFGNRIGAARPQWNQNQYGASAGGPVKKDKLFFNFAWEGFAANTALSSATNVPTADLQNGIISEVYSASGALLNNVVDPLNRCTIVRTPGTAAKPGFWTITNLYQGQCGDPTNKVLKTYFPGPNTSSLPGSNWFINTPLTNRQNQYNGRLDYNLSSKQRIFGRYTYWAVQDTGHSEFNRANGWGTDDGRVLDYTHQAVIGDTYILNATTVLDVRGNFVRQTALNYAYDNAVDPSKFGAAYAALGPQLAIHTLPGYNLSGGIRGFYNFGNFPNQFSNWYETYGLNANLVKTFRSHSLKFGAEGRLMDDLSLNFGSSGGGSFTYNTTFTGDEWASFLMGYPTAVTFTKPLATAGYMYYQAYYVTDTWQVKRNLTLTLGARYELPGAVAERNNSAVVLLPTAVDPYTGIKGTDALVNSKLYPDRTTVQARHNLVAPRIGFAWRVMPDMVVRGGYGISFLPNDLTGVTPAGFVNSATTAVNVPGSGAPTPVSTILANILATGLNNPTGNTNPAFMTNLGSTTRYLGQNVTGPVPFQPYPYTQQWNTTISRQFKGDMAIEAGYAGLHGVNLPGAGNRGLNQLSSDFFSLGAGLLTNQPCANANNLVISVGQCNRPYPYYNNLQDTARFYAYSNYHSLQIKGQKRFGAAGTLMGNYTWAKNLSNTDTQNGFLEAKPAAQIASSGVGQIQNWNNLAAEYSLISYNVASRAVINYVLNLPFGKGQRFATNLSAPANALIAGWSLSGIATFQSGFPLFFNTATQSKLQSSFGAGTTRPNVVPGCNKAIDASSRSRVNSGQWFNTACFTYAGDYAFGSESRTDPALRTDGVKNFDVSLQKSTTIHESMRLELRAEFYNVFNRVQFAPPVTTQGSSTFGQILAQGNKPRQIQLSMRFSF
jgi:hypothetical protein